MTFSSTARDPAAKYGFPMKIRMPTKLGFKNPKHVMAIAVINNDPAATGRTRATTGSAGCEASPSRSSATRLAKPRAAL